MSVYLKAAKNVWKYNGDGWDGKGYPSCIAISDIECSQWDRSKYADLFQPRKGYFVAGTIWGSKWSKEPEELKECRVLALLFMHWMVTMKDKK